MSTEPGSARLCVGFLWNLTFRAEVVSSEHPGEVVRRGTAMMPFHLEQTSRICAKQPHGVSQPFIATRLVNQRQIGLVRRHLSKTAGEFASGSFSPTLLDVIDRSFDARLSVLQSHAMARRGLAMG